MGFVKEEADDLDDLAQTFRRGIETFSRGEHHQQALVLTARLETGAAKLMPTRRTRRDFLAN